MNKKIKYSLFGIISIIVLLMLFAISGIWAASHTDMELAELSKEETPLTFESENNEDETNIFYQIVYNDENSRVMLTAEQTWQQPTPIVKTESEGKYLLTLLDGSTYVLVYTKIADHAKKITIYDKNANYLQTMNLK